LTAAEGTFVQQSQQGSRQAYASLIRQHYGSVYMVCLGYLGNPADAEDAAQEVFLKGYMKIRTLRQPERFGVWIRQIAKNESQNILRRKKKKTMPLQFYQEAACPRPTRNDFEEDLQSAIAAIPADLRVPLLMYYFDGRKVEHVAQTLGVSRIRVYRQLKEALRRLGEILQKGETR
jgi:RNA polymerase sigma-70 factor (ECF subfamily)